MTEIPLLDLRRSPGELAPELRRACETVGFFYLRGHGVPTPLREKALASARRFFELPPSVKEKVAVNHRHRGYLGPGEAVLSRGVPADAKESFVWGMELPESDPDVVAGETLMGPNVWPSEVPEMRAACLAYFEAVIASGKRLLEAFAVSLAMPASFFRDPYRKPLARASVIRYPPQREGAPRFGTTEHTDYGCVTLLWQDSVGGLEIQRRDGTWMEAAPMADTLLVNLGDFMARWTNDSFRSTRHRVLNRSGRERWSLPVFLDPDFDVVVECLPTCQSDARPPRYPPIRCGDYISARFDDAFVYRQDGRKAGGVSHG